MRKPLQENSYEPLQESEQVEEVKFENSPSLTNAADTNQNIEIQDEGWAENGEELDIDLRELDEEPDAFGVIMNDQQKQPMDNKI